MNEFDTGGFEKLVFGTNVYEAPPVGQRIYFLNMKLGRVRRMANFYMYLNFSRAARAWGLRAAAEWCEKHNKPWQHTKRKQGRRV